MMDYHEIVGGLSVAISLSMGGIYIRDTLRGKTKPHVFTWLVWGFIMGIAAAVSFAGGAVIGGLVLGAGSAINLTIAALSFRFGEKSITRSDWLMFLSALFVIPVWVVTKEPLNAALLVSLIDLLACTPTFRKTWVMPSEENLTVFSWNSVASGLTVLSLTPLTFVTGLYPTVVLITEIIIVSIILLRRNVEKGA